MFGIHRPAALAVEVEEHTQLAPSELSTFPVRAQMVLVSLGTQIPVEASVVLVVGLQMHFVPSVLSI
jgi:hypothetical protein